MFSLKIGRTLDVPVKFTLRDGARDVPFTVTLTVKRPTLDELRDLFDRLEAKTLGERELLAELVLGWQQTLVLGDDDKPAAYSAEALDLMCSVIGLRLHLANEVAVALGRSFAPAAQNEAKLGN